MFWSIGFVLIFSVLTGLAYGWSDLFERFWRSRKCPILARGISGQSMNADGGLNTNGVLWEIANGPSGAAAAGFVRPAKQASCQSMAR
jgi:hypothetical protein